MIADEAFAAARTALLTANPTALEACLPALEQAVAGLHRRDPETLRKALRVKNLFETAVEFHRGWMNVRGALAGYDRTGAPAQPDGGGRFHIHV